MRVRQAGTIDDAVVRLLSPLTPAAVLLADSPDAAVRLLADALSLPGALHDVPSGRRALARRVLHQRRWAAEQVLESTASAPADEDAALADALRALPSRYRATAVLHLLAEPTPGAPDGAAAEEIQAALIRLRGDLARRDADQRRERSRTAALYRAPGTSADPEQPPLDLPERLARLASGRPLPPDAIETIAAGIGAARHVRRRRRLGAAAGVLVAGLLVALVPLLPKQPPATPTVFGEAARGALTGDRNFVTAMAEAPWPGAPGAAESRRVVFADDVPGGRWALVAAGGNRSSPAAIAWFTGPTGASADRMTLSLVRLAPDPALPASLSDPATGALVVVGAPGDRISVSARPEVQADGSLTHSFRAVPTSHGTAVVGMTPVPGAAGGSASLRVERQGRRLDVPLPVLLHVTGSSGLVPVTPRMGTSPYLEDVAVQTRLRSVLSQLGEVPTATPVTALWSGELPGPNDRPTRLSVVAVKQPSGAFVVTAPFSYTADDTGRTGSSWCATGVLPAGARLDERVVAVRCDLTDLSIENEVSRFLVVVGPRGAAFVRLLDEHGAELSRHPLHDGVAVIRSPGKVAEVSVRTAGGSMTAVPFVDADVTG